jgi:hypothetical protein
MKNAALWRARRSEFLDGSFDTLHLANLVAPFKCPPAWRSRKKDRYERTCQNTAR